VALAALALPARADQTVTPTETLVRLTVSPAPAPRPALRYLLLPELREMNPGNPISAYLNCFMERSSSGREGFGQAALRQADRAARLDKPDWQILLQAKADGINLLLPDVQVMRALAAALQERFRSEVALRHFDDAVRTAKTMLAMSRHMGEHPTLIGDLVGMALAFVAIGPLEEMLEQPGSPNLYWALTNLPTPLISLNKASEGENIWPMAHMGDLTDKVPMSEEQIKKITAFLDNILGEGKPIKPGDGAGGYLDARTKDEGKLNAARRRIIEAGLPEERVMRFPPDQVILLDEKREYEERRDEFMKLMTLPPWQFEPLFSQIEPQI